MSDATHEYSRQLQNVDKVPLKRDWDRNQAYTNDINLLDRGFREIRKEIMDFGADHDNIMSLFTLVQEPVPKDKGWGLTMIGYTFPYADKRVEVGEHYVARKHAKIPQTCVWTNSYYAIRNTYTVDHREWEDMDPSRVGEFYADQLTAFGKSYQNWMFFTAYLIFADLGNNTHWGVYEVDASDGTKKPISEEVADYYFEDFKKTLFYPKLSDGQGYPWYDMNLALERIPVIDKGCKYLPTSHPYIDHIRFIRDMLVSNKEYYSRESTKYPANLQLNEECKRALSQREKISRVAKDMWGTSIKYRMWNPKQRHEGFALRVAKEDLICIMDNKTDDDLLDGMIGILEPNRYGFTADNLNVGKVVKTGFMRKGEALIIHKDALKMIFVRNKFGVAPYTEPECTNYFHAYGYYLDVFPIFPACYIACEDMRYQGGHK